MAAAIAPVGLCGGALGAARTNGIRRGATSARALGFKGGEGMGQSASLARRQVARVGPKVAGRGGAVVTRAVTGPRETRLGSILTTIPQRLDLYFRVRKGRKLLWKIIFAATGFYSANVLSLTFGVLGINDVVTGAF